MSSHLNAALEAFRKQQAQKATEAVQAVTQSKVHASFFNSVWPHSRRPGEVLNHFWPTIAISYYLPPALSPLLEFVSQ